MEKLQGFLHRRTERHNYLDMFPLLKALIQQKKQEQAEEEPFKWLLASQAMQTLNLSEEQAAELVPLSIERYKFKKKVHRALVEQGTGSEAFLQCMAELQFLMTEHQNRQHKQTSGVFDALVSQVLEAHPEAVLVAHRKGDEYVAYVPETLDDHVFMRVLTLTFRNGHLKVTEDLRWKTLIKNHHRWHALYSTERLKGWKFYARADEHLTDMEITQLGGQLTELFMQHHSRKDAYEQDHRILAVTFDLDEHKFRVYHHTLKRYGFSTKLQRCVLRTTPKVIKDSGGVQVTHWHNSRDMQGETLPWEDSEERNHFGFTRRCRERVLDLHESHLHTLQEQRLEAQKERERRQARARQVQSLLTALHQQWLQLFWEHTHDKFMQEYGDLTLWEGFKKMIREPSSPVYQTHRGTLEKLLGFVLDHQRWAGRVVEEVLQAHNLQHGDAVLDLPEALRALRVPEVNDAV
ncbi:hypothetical protein [Deinococcus roseus]|uniref:Uncharacterized protein n=1 Tax=Deinococcus roseus TaxID=392414 RepID=A0ABQ2D7L1_9DEIO|nr:hypothetical protein [Deinococcus roseus]GGJ44620.1 hypothetical protein GCM10008938_33490 [Deinococcus roseus]